MISRLNRKKVRIKKYAYKIKKKYEQKKQKRCLDNNKTSDYLVFSFVE